MTKQTTASEARTVQTVRSKSVGKIGTSRRAQTLGIKSEGILIVGEDASEFNKFATRIIEELEPVGPVEQELAEHAVVILWRIKRIPRLEASVIAARDAATAENSPAKREQASLDHRKIISERYRQAAEKFPRPSSTASISTPPKPREDESPPSKPPEPKKDEPPDAEEAIGRALIHDSENGNVLGQISRCETSLNNSLARTLSMLKTLQSARADREQAEASKTVA